ncbi:GNAT family N-acetyltransferase [Skermanella rosea]|uniref:GNAT family N-acetyltransferase n=1 Tax=Skermanella rosea TaxID=1817965 RepID=UPI001934106E|nr:GNAT family N-acetyltransferase [Skermanella rosea]UEM05487.1 GNAT family N-acetyltransferase [Skermanella rosea]
MLIRDYDVADAPALVELYGRSVRGIGPRDYSARQVEAWASLAPTPGQLHRRVADGRRVLVAADDRGQPLGFGDIAADGHIGYFYCSPEAAGTGVAAALYGALEDIALKALLTRIHVEASEAARRFFLRQGFTVLQRRDLLIGDVPIHNFAMEKRWPLGSR